MNAFELSQKTRKEKTRTKKVAMIFVSSFIISISYFPNPLAMTLNEMIKTNSIIN